MVNALTSVFIFLVLYEHAFYFGLPLGELLTPVGDSLAIFTAVGGFIFLSGYKITQSKDLLSVKQFIIDRFYRLYPLYFIALTVHAAFIQPDSGLQKFWLHAGLMNMVFYRAFGEPFLTMYFVGLLVLYYAVYLATRPFLRDTVAFVCVQAIIYIGMAVLHVIAPFNSALFEERFFIYYPFFVGGMLAAHGSKTKAIRMIFSPIVWSVILLSVIIAFFLGVIPDSDTLFRRIHIPYLLSMPAYIGFLVSLVGSQRKTRGTYAIYDRVATSSYLMFLFHRPVWLAMTALVDAIAPGISTIGKWTFVYITGTVVLYQMSYNAQRVYDVFVRRKREHHPYGIMTPL